MRNIFAFLAAVAFSLAPLCASAAQSNLVSSTSSITSATTTQVVAGVPGQRIYLWYAGEQASGSQSSATFYFEYGTGSSCSSPTKLSPGTITSPTTSGSWTTAYAGAPMSNVVGGVIPSPIPLQIPIGNSVCIVTAGTTTAAYGVAVYSLSTNIDQ
ncbi:MAG: hypothetical protein KGL39_49545 [Patescibacteria group bacterium]|nr:hypothetical protein [Patescibacteria group bacterium]